MIKPNWMKGKVKPVANITIITHWSLNVMSWHRGYRTWLRQNEIHTTLYRLGCGGGS